MGISVFFIRGECSAAIGQFAIPPAGFIGLYAVLFGRDAVFTFETGDKAAAVAVADLEGDGEDAEIGIFQEQLSFFQPDIP